MKHTLYYMLIAALLPLSANAQHQRKHPFRNMNQMSAHVDSLTEAQSETIQKLIKRLDKMEKAEAQKQKQAKMQALLEKAKQMSRDKNRKSEPKKFVSGIRHQSAMNPNISLGGDHYVTIGSSDSDLNRIPSETSWGSGQFMIREFELAIEAPLDPYSRGKAYLSFGDEGVVLEEGYLEWLNLPGGINAKLGQMKTQFGKINRYHDHAMPQFDRPLVMVNFFGNTGVKGMGGGLNFLLPKLTAHVNELDLEVISGGVDQSFTSESKHRLIYVTHYKNYYDLNRSTYLELGLSGATGHNDALANYRSVVGACDLTLKWTPPGRAKYKGLEWHSEALFSNRETAGDAVKSWGLFSSLQYRLNAKWLTSVRFDYSQLPWDADLEEVGGAVTLDYWQSEFVLLRFQYTLIDRNFDESDHRFTFQTNWAMGPHKHEAY